MIYNLLIPLTFFLLTGTSCSDPSILYNGLPIGTVVLFTGLNVPPNWLQCDGSNISRTRYSHLFSVIGTLYGVGDHVNTYTLPDFRGRFPLGTDGRKSESVGINTGGASVHELSVAELPTHAHDQGTLTTQSSGSHMHSYNDPGHNHGGKTGSGPMSQGGWGLYKGGGAHDGSTHAHVIPSGKTGITIDTSGIHTHSLSGASGLIGSSQPFSIMPPFQTVDYIIFAGQ
jgi:microcystin-dependent protein